MTSPGRPRSSMTGTNTWTPWITPHRLTAITRCQFSAGPKMPLPGWMPALFISTSVPPKRCRTAASSRRTSSTRLTSVSSAMTSSAPPGLKAAISSAARASRSAPRSAIATRSPSPANRLAAARPMPAAPPVTTATEPGVRAGWVMSGAPWLPWQGWDGAARIADLSSRAPRQREHRAVDRFSAARPMSCAAVESMFRLPEIARRRGVLERRARLADKDH